GRQWFGTFIAIEPGKKGDLSFSYLLPANIIEQINSGEYNLLVQKQIGSNGVQLNLNINFDKPLSHVTPLENVENFGDNRYDLNMDLSVDRYFEVKLK
ncbi:MAG: hypothetical protein Q7S24_00780, partial [bacterium]|nr:hypothetical protein [bacterium]